MIEKQKQLSINKSNQRGNLKRITHAYKVGDKVLLQNTGILRKLAMPYSGPDDVQEVFTNGTMVINKGAVLQRVNIRRVVPYHK